MAISFEM